MLNHSLPRTSNLVLKKAHCWLLILLVVYVNLTGILIIPTSAMVFKDQKSNHNTIDTEISQRSRNISGFESSYPNQIVQQEEGENPGFGDLIETLDAPVLYGRTVTFSRSGRYIAFGGREGDIYLWDMINGNLSWRVWGAHRPSPYGTESLAFSPDERFLASAGENSSVFIWRVIDGEQVDVTFEGSSELGFQHILFSPDGSEIVASTINGSLFAWDVTTGEEIYNFSLPGSAEIYNPDLLITYSCSRDIALSPDGSLLATGNGHGTVYLWNLTTKTIINNFTGHTDLVRTLTFSPDGTLLVSGSYDDDIRVWNVTSCSELASISPISVPSDMVTSVSFSPDGAVLASSRGKTIRFWDVISWKELTPITIPMSGEDADFIAFSPTGSILASIGSGEPNVALWNVATGQLDSHTLKGHETSIYSLAFGLNGTVMASADGNAVIKVWNITDNRQFMYDLIGQTSTVLGTPIDFSPDGQWLVSGSGDTIIRFWNITSGLNQYNVTGHTSSVLSVSFSPDGHWLTSGDVNGIIKLWNVTDKANITDYDDLAGHTSAVTNLKFSPNSGTLASSEIDFPSILLWNVTTRRVISTLRGHTRRISSLAFSPNGVWLTSGSWDNSVKFWNIGNGDSIPNFELTHTEVNAINFSPDGLTFAIGCQDGTIYLWDVTERKLLTNFRAHPHGVSDVIFSPDNTLLASCGGETDILLWGIDPLPVDIDLDGILDTWESQYNLDPSDFYDGLADDDGDGLMNSMEFSLKTDPLISDSDDDEIPDLWEYVYNTDPLTPDATDDSDNDELPNLYEFQYGLNGLVDDAQLDLDSDNLTNLQEFQYGSWPNQSDSDLDGMSDLYEYQNSKKMGMSYVGLFPLLNDSYSDKDDDGMYNLWEYQMKLNASDASDAADDEDEDELTNLQECQLDLNATNSDTDGDLMPDGWEYQMELVPHIDDAGEDKDDDGLTNLQEYQLHLNATNSDTDGDLMPDGWEYQMGLNPRIDDAAGDLDNDDMPNLWEYQMELNASLDDAAGDLDNDNMPNLWEFKYGFNANDPSDADQDSDQDGIKNKDEKRAGTNPRDFWSFPLLSFSVLHIATIFLLLIAGLGGICFIIFQHNQRMKLTSKLKAPDYQTALRVRQASLSDYSALLEAEIKAKTVLEEATTEYFQGNFAAAIQKYEQTLDSMERLGVTRYVAETAFWLAYIYKLRGTLTDDNTIFQRFPSPPHDDPIVPALAKMIQALIAETKNNWGEAEEAWQKASKYEALDTDLRMICQEALAESSFRMWFFDQTYQKQARMISRLDEWQDTGKENPRKGSLCPVHLLRARLALASYRFTEVEEWLDRCQHTADEAGLIFYRDLAQRETERLLQHKERIELLFEADKLLSPEDRGKLLQDYIKKAVLSMESVLDSEAEEAM